MDELRKQLDVIDQQMRDLFEQRLDVVSQVAAYKAEHNIPVLDKQREAIIIEKGLSLIKNEQYKAYYQEFIELQLKVSKQLQEDYINKVGK